MSAITLKNFKKSYKNFTLGEINLEIPEGMIVGIIGKNGAGKTTLIKSILGLLKYEGELSIMNQIDLDNEDLRQQIGFVLDDPIFPGRMTISRINQIMSNIFKDWNETQFLKYLKHFNIQISAKYKELSKGNQQKIAILIALCHNAKMLVLDEPLNNLDPPSRIDMQDIFREYMQTEENTILISSHILSDLEKICDYILFLQEGQITLFEQKDQLIENYGIAKVTHDQYQVIKAKYPHIRKHQFGVDVLIPDKKAFCLRYPDYIVDDATLEEIIVMLESA